MQVAKRTFVKALNERNSVILVPGGQAELLVTYRIFKPKQLVVHCRHKGVRTQQGMLQTASCCTCVSAMLLAATAAGLDVC